MDNKTYTGKQTMGRGLPENEASCSCLFHTLPTQPLLRRLTRYAGAYDANPPHPPPGPAAGERVTPMHTGSYEFPSPGATQQT